MPTEIAVALISGFFSLIAACIAGYVVIKVKQMHDLINSRMDEMLRLTREAAFAAGKVEEQDEAAARLESGE